MFGTHIFRGKGLAITGAGLGLGTWVAEQAGLKLPPEVWVPIGLLAALTVIGGLALTVKERPEQGDGDPPSTFAELEGVEGAKISGNRSTGDRFLNAVDSDDLEVRDNVHEPDD